MPGIASLHINTALTNLAVEYGPSVMIADQVFSPLGVGKASDKYFIIDADRQDLKSADDRRGQSGDPNMIDFAVSSDNYSCVEHVLGDLVTFAEQENADTPLDPKMTAVKQILSRLGINKEIEAASLCSSGITQTKAASGTTSKWAASDATAISDVQTQIAVVESAVGVTPNVGWCDVAVYRALRNSVEVKAAIKSGVLTVAELDRVVADILGLERIIVSKGKKNTSKSTTKSLSAIWGKNFYLGYINPMAAQKAVTFGLTFDWKGGNSINGYAVSEQDDEWKKGTKLQAARWYDQKVVVAAAAAKVTDCIA